LTKPTITYGHGFLTDCNDATGWTKFLVNMTDPQTSLTVDKDDIFILEGVCDSSYDEYVYYLKDIPNISSNVYTTYLVRWKTSVASNGLGAKVRLIFTSGNQDIIGATAPEFSTSWKLSSGTITAGKTIDQIAIFADDYPDTIATGTYQVYIDFIMLCKGLFTFPNTQFGSEFNPPPRCSLTPIPSRISDLTQNLGSPSATWTASCNLDISNATDDWKRPQNILSPKTDYVKGEVFFDIAHNSYQEPFQWLDTGKEQFKVTLDTLRFPERSDSHTLDLTFKEYSRSSKSNESYVERFGLNL